MSHEAVRQAAEKHYAKLIRGDYKGFVSGYAGAESLPPDYRSQLVDATAQFMASPEMQRLVAVQATSDTLCPDSTAYVLLQLHFSDSTSEQIGVPLVLQEDQWKMKH